MMKNGFLIAAALGALLTSAGASAQAQPQQQRQDDILQQLLGAVFGTNQQASEQALEADWNQGRRPFEQRRNQLDARIDAAVRDGSLSWAEADQIRREYNEIVRLEAQYAADGSVSQQQRDDLRARYRAMSQRIGDRGSNAQAGYQQDDDRWQPMAARRWEFQDRMNAGLRDGSISQTDARRLRADWQSLTQLEASYQRGGIDSREEAELWRRYNAIDASLGGSFGNDRNTARWSQMESRLLMAERQGSISRNDAAQLRIQLQDLARLDAAYISGGYSTDERAYLTRRYSDIDTALKTYRR